MSGLVIRPEAVDYAVVDGVRRMNNTLAAAKRDGSDIEATLDQIEPTIPAQLRSVVERFGVFDISVEDICSIEDQPTEEEQHDDSDTDNS